MTKKEIVRVQKRITKIWNEIDKEIAGTGLASLIEELVDLEILLEAESNK